MDMTAEFYLSTVDRVFKNREIALNKFTVDGHKVDISKITTVAVMTVEGEEDDISAPGQCGRIDLCTGLAKSKNPTISNRVRDTMVFLLGKAGGTTSAPLSLSSSTKITNKGLRPYLAISKILSNVDCVPRENSSGQGYAVPCVTEFWKFSN